MGSSCSGSSRRSPILSLEFDESQVIELHSPADHRMIAQNECIALKGLLERFHLTPQTCGVVANECLVEKLSRMSIPCKLLRGIAFSSKEYQPYVWVGVTLAYGELMHLNPLPPDGVWEYQTEPAPDDWRAASGAGVMTAKMWNRQFRHMYAAGGAEAFLNQPAHRDSDMHRVWELFLPDAFL